MSRSARTCTALDQTVRQRTVHATRAALALFMGALICWMMGSRVQAETISVCLDGSCDHTDVQAAINAATNGDVIEVSGETYLLEATIDTLGKAVTIRGTVDPLTGEPTTVLDGQGLHRVLQCVSFEGPDTLLVNLTICNGLASLVDIGFFPSALGGGALCLSSSPSYANCTFKNNSAEGGEKSLGRGGGVYLYESTSSFTNCTFRNNSADYDGGGMTNDASTPSLDNCIFINNSAFVGGGISNNDNDGTLTDCLFVRNVAEYFGGGLSNSFDSSSSLENCTFTNNSAGERGGGMANQNSDATLSNCTFTANLADDYGGGMFSEGTIDGVDCMPNLVNCKFISNQANRGGGVHCGAIIGVGTDSPTFSGCSFEQNVSLNGGGLSFSPSTSGQLTLIHCTFTENSAIGSGGGIVHSGPFSNINLTNCTFVNNTAGGDGGGFFSSGVCDFAECSFTNNEANRGAGASLYTGASSNSFDITGCTFQNNFATSTAGGIFYLYDSATVTLKLGNTTVCGNTPTQLSPIAYTDNGGNCISDVCLDCDTCPGDLGGDGDVGGADLTILLNQWGCTGEDCTADVDGNGTVDGADLTTILSNWGACSN